MKIKATLWTFGLLGGLMFKTLVLFSRIEIRGYEKEKMDPGDNGLLLMVNHPSLWEPALAPFLFFPKFLFLERYAPFSTPDKINYYDKWWFSPLRCLCFPINRGQPRDELRTVKEVLRPAALSKLLILYPEGGRTFKGIERRGRKTSLCGREMARFPGGLKRLFLGLPTKVVPVWIEGGERVFPNKTEKTSIFARLSGKIPRIWRKVIIVIGEPLDASHLGKDEIIDYLEDALLALADQAGK